MKCKCGNTITNRGIKYCNGEEVCDRCRGVFYWSKIGFGYNPEFTPYPDRRYNKLLGVELEVDGGGENKRKALKTLSYFTTKNGESFLSAKADGSLEDGIEFITHPATLEYHRSLEDNYRRAFDYLLGEGYRGHDANTSGIHVHIDRRWLGSSQLQQEINLLHLTVFVEKWWNEIKRFSRRTDAQLANYARRLGMENFNIYSILNKYVEAKYGSGKFNAVNIEHLDTVEIRVFRSTLKYESYMAILEFVHFLVEFIKKNTVETIIEDGWYSFVKSLENTNQIYLLPYLEQRNLRGVGANVS